MDNLALFVPLDRGSKLRQDGQGLVRCRLFCLRGSRKLALVDDRCVVVSETFQEQVGLFIVGFAVLTLERGFSDGQNKAAGRF